MTYLPTYLLDLLGEYRVDVVLLHIEQQHTHIFSPCLALAHLPSCLVPRPPAWPSTTYLLPLLVLTHTPCHAAHPSLPWSLLYISSLTFSHSVSRPDPTCYIASSLPFRLSPPSVLLPSLSLTNIPVSKAFMPRLATLL